MSERRAVCVTLISVGPVAQLGERLVRNEEASGSIPLRSTMFQQLSSTLYHNHVPLRSNSVDDCTLGSIEFRQSLVHHAHHLRNRAPLRSRNELRVDVHSGRNP